MCRRSGGSFSSKYRSTEFRRTRGVRASFLRFHIKHTQGGVDESLLPAIEVQFEKSAQEWRHTKVVPVKFDTFVSHLSILRNLYADYCDDYQEDPLRDSEDDKPFWVHVKKHSLKGKTTMNACYAYLRQATARRVNETLTATPREGENGGAPVVSIQGRGRNTPLSRSLAAAWNDADEEEEDDDGEDDDGEEDDEEDDDSNTETSSGYEEDDDLDSEEGNNKDRDDLEVDQHEELDFPPPDDTDLEGDSRPRAYAGVGGNANDGDRSSDLDEDGDEEDGDDSPSDDDSIVGAGGRNVLGDKEGKRNRMTEHQHDYEHEEDASLARTSRGRRRRHRSKGASDESASDDRDAKPRSAKGSRPKKKHKISRGRSDDDEEDDDRYSTSVDDSYVKVGGRNVYRDKEGKRNRMTEHQHDYERDGVSPAKKSRGRRRRHRSKGASDEISSDNSDASRPTKRRKVYRCRSDTDSDSDSDGATHQRKKNSKTMIAKSKRRGDTSESATPSRDDAFVPFDTRRRRKNYTAEDGEETRLSNDTEEAIDEAST
jgi:hypothetical protein